MNKKNKVFIATSLDGYIAKEDGSLDWLNSIPNPENIDMGFNEFMSEIDALIMGRNTFEIVDGFDVEWPYKKPVFVLSHALSEIPEKYIGNVELVNGSLKTVLKEIHEKGFKNLYIDGGKTIQSFLKEDLIDELTITIIPLLLGGGIPLFGKTPNQLSFECIDTKIFLNQIVQNKFERKR